MFNLSTATLDERGNGWRLVIHGGAGTMTRDRISAEHEGGIRAGLSRALDAGIAVLVAGGPALDAVTECAKVLEDDPCFNAGRGSALSYEGRVELDAAVMDGQERRAGAVAGLRTVRNPVLLARKVMEASPHVLLTGAGAEEFADTQPIERVDPSWFEIPERRRQWQEFCQRKTGQFDVDMKYGTVGAVARDCGGHVAAATSTGGLTGKRWGRIGDSPLIGAGTYADDRTCAVSATGAGEYFIRLGIAHEIAARMRLRDEGLKEAAEAVIAELSELGGIGGVIGAAADGELVWVFNAPGMYRGFASSTGGRAIAIYGDEA